MNPRLYGYIAKFDDFFPDDSKLHLSQAIADTSVHAVAEGGVLSWIVAVYDELIGIFDVILIPVTRDVPHADPVIFPDQLSTQFSILGCSPCHMGTRRLPADDFRNQAAAVA